MTHYIVDREDILHVLWGPFDSRESAQHRLDNYRVNQDYKAANYRIVTVEEMWAAKRKQQTGGGGVPLPTMTAGTLLAAKIERRRKITEGEN